MHKDVRILNLINWRNFFMEDAVQPACGLATVFNQSTVLGCSQAQEK